MSIVEAMHARVRTLSMDIHEVHAAYRPGYDSPHNALGVGGGGGLGPRDGQKPYWGDPCKIRVFAAH